MPPGSDPVMCELSQEWYAVSRLEAFDHIDRSLVDQEIHTLFSKDQIGVGLQVIYCNTCSDLPLCYTEAGDDSRRIKGIGNLRHLYTNFFDRYCTSDVTSIGYDETDGPIGYVCYMFWDTFVLHPGNASPGMIAAAIDVMAHALATTNESCIVSAIHGLGHWVRGAPQAYEILESWLEEPTTHDRGIYEYARQATTGCIL